MPLLGSPITIPNINSDLEDTEQGEALQIDIVDATLDVLSGGNFTEDLSIAPMGTSMTDKTAAPNSQQPEMKNNSSELKNSTPSFSGIDFFSRVEPFLEMDIAGMRQKLVDDALVQSFHHILIEQLGDKNDAGFIDRLINLLAGVKAEMHALKAAYVESVRYQEPDFSLAIPAKRNRIRPDSLTIDMRGDITGSNWFYAEPEGRWAGPENESSLFFPAMGPGVFDISVTIIAEIIKGIVDKMTILLNKQPILFEWHNSETPALIKARTVVSENYRFPFWSLKFRFPTLVSPVEFGSTDTRKLAIKVSFIQLTKVE